MLTLSWLLRRNDVTKCERWYSAVLARLPSIATAGAGGGRDCLQSCAGAGVERIGLVTAMASWSVRMLVTPYPVSPAWSKPEQDEDTMQAQHCSASSSLISSDLIDIQTTLSETFTPHTSLLHPHQPPHPSSTTYTNSDYFSQHFENVMESVPSPATTNSVSSSHSSIGQRDINYEDYSTNGNVNSG